MIDDKETLITKDRRFRSIVPNPSDYSEKRKDEVEDVDSDIVIAVFVVAFDYKKGNILEWCMPGDINYCGIEFKAIFSGAHLVKSDFVYFRHLGYYGLGCYAMRRLEESEGERGIRMKTVGVLTNSYLNLHQHIGFLESSVRKLLINPGDYDRLVAFYSDKMSKTKMMAVSRPLDLNDIETVTMSPFDYESFLNRFGVKIFSLWKLMLLRKRVLFLSKPPIGPVCQQVLCCHRLASHDITQIKYLSSHPLFNISLSDTDSMTPTYWQQAFVACTTDQAFQMKKSFYDCLIHNDSIQIVDDDDDLLKRAVSHSSSDREKFDKLLSIKDSFDCDKNSWEECVISFFKSENNRLLQALLDLANSGEPEITSSHIEYLGFHPKNDKDFLILLLETYGIDLILQIDGLCC